MNESSHPRFRADSRTLKETATTMTASKRTRWLIAGSCALAAVIVSTLTWASSRGGDPTNAASTTTSWPTRTTLPAASHSLKAPSATVAEDSQFLTEVTEVDPALTNYEKRSGNVALRSLLTDGSAFCAFLQRDRDIDAAMVSVVVGARQVESQTHLPLSVTTFNTVDTVALLTLCPSLQSVVPAKDLVKIRKLGSELAG
jgi:hypothetical protein